MARALSVLGDRLLAAVLPQTTAAGCLPTQHYTTCKYKSSCDNAYTTQYRCTTNCAGVANCIPTGSCCKSN